MDGTAPLGCRTRSSTLGTTLQRVTTTGTRHHPSCDPVHLPVLSTPQPRGHQASNYANRNRREGSVQQKNPATVSGRRAVHFSEKQATLRSTSRQNNMEVRRRRAEHSAHTRIPPRHPASNRLFACLLHDHSLNHVSLQTRGSHPEYSSPTIRHNEPMSSQKRVPPLGALARRSPVCFVFRYRRRSIDMATMRWYRPVVSKNRFCSPR